MLKRIHELTGEWVPSVDALVELPAFRWKRERVVYYIDKKTKEEIAGEIFLPIAVYTKEEAEETTTTTENTRKTNKDLEQDQIKDLIINIVKEKKVDLLSLIDSLEEEFTVNTQQVMDCKEMLEDEGLIKEGENGVLEFINGETEEEQSSS